MFNFIRKLFVKKDQKVENTTGEGNGKNIEEITDGIVETLGSAEVEEEPIAKQMPSTKGLICINNGEKNRYIHPDDPIPEGWVLGGKKKTNK